MTPPAWTAPVPDARAASHARRPRHRHRRLRCRARVLARSLRRGRLAGPALSVASLVLAALAFAAFLLHAQAGAPTSGTARAAGASALVVPAAPSTVPGARSAVVRAAAPTPAADRDAALPRTYTVYLTSSERMATVIAEALRAADQDRIRGDETPLCGGVLVVNPADEFDATAVVAVDARVARVSVVDLRAAPVGADGDGS